MNENITESNVIEKKKNIMPVVIGAVVIAIALFAVIGVLSVKGYSEKKYNDKLNIAERYLSDLDYERAIVAFEEAIEIDPKSYAAYEGLANVYIAMADDELSAGNYDKAIEYYNEAIDVMEDAKKYLSDDDIKKADEYIEDVQNSIDDANDAKNEEEKKQENEQDNEIEESADEGSSNRQFGWSETITETEYNLDGSVKSEYMSLYAEYDVDGNIITRIEYNPDGSILSEEHY